MSPDRLNVSMDMTSEDLEMNFKTRFLLLPQQQGPQNCNAQLLISVSESEDTKLLQTLFRIVSAHLKFVLL